MHKEVFFLYNCRNCGGNLRFDIPSQRLKCPYCESNYDCYEFEDKEASRNQDSYDVTVFTCPACGGEIISNDQSIAEFCSYCGSSVVLEARLRKETRPKKILPFKKTSEDCINAYKSKLKGAMFAPKELKDPKFLENFRGIYIPYWSYRFSQKGEVSLTSTHEYRKGDYDITDYYHVSGDIDAWYDGIFYDASAAFDDSISGAIAPYDPKQMKDFVPAYLSGFYADVADVPSSVYLEEANSIVNHESLKVIQRDRGAGKYSITDNKGTPGTNKSLCTVVEEPEAAMLPVWFLTWRDRDRVAYMAVNGQTGKVAADIPIDIRKYLLASLLCSVPLYFILNFLFSFKASTSLFLAGVLALITGIIHSEEISSIRKKDNRELDRGFQQIKKRRAQAKAKREAEAAGLKESAVERNSLKGKQKAKKEGKTQTVQKKPASLFERLVNIGLAVSFIIFVVGFFVGFMTGGLFAAIFSRFTLNMILIVSVFVLWWFIFLDGEEVTQTYRPQTGILGSQLAAILAALINIVHPVWDIVYYIGMILVYIGILLTIIQIIRRYNLLITRPIPELHNRGKEQV